MAASLLKSSDGGIAATHPAPLDHLLLVGTATGAESNTFRRRIAPIACWRVEDLRFEFDSSFVRPEMQPELQDLAGLVDHVRKSYPGSPPASLSVFGHADPSGDDDYNKKLSGRRAEAVYAMLIRDADLWENLYSHPSGGDDWGTRAIQTMLDRTGYPPGPIDGISGSQTTGAVKDFQKDHQLPADGTLTRNTRKQLFLAYMDAICTRPDGSPFRLQRTDFLGNGADAGGKGDYQGCSEFNPVLVFSQQEKQEYSKPGKKEERNADNAPNRRVVVFLFRAGLRVEPGRWPCARASDTVGACKKRFWSDGEARRSNQAERREFKNTRNTFACRFYHRLACESPCEGVLPVVMPWTAEWDRDTVWDEEVGLMRLTAPDLAAGQPVVFEVTQSGFGVVGQVEAVSQAGGAEARWDNWYDPRHPERITQKVQLKQGEDFPKIEFAFTATAAGRTVPSAALRYEDSLLTQVVYNIDGEAKNPVPERAYTIYTPWGSRTGKTKKLVEEDGWILEDGLPPGGASVVLGDKTLLAG